MQQIARNAKDLELQELRDYYGLLDLRSQARKKYLEKLYMRELKANCENGVADPVMMEQYNNTIRAEALSKQNDKRCSGNLVFITLSPFDDISLPFLLETIDIALNKTWLSRYCYAIEQRGTTPETSGTGIHFHLLLLRDGKRYSEIQREFKSSFKHVCQNVKSTHFLHFQIMEETPHNKKHLHNYISSDKKEKEGQNKREKQVVDKIFREDNGLEPIYYVGLDATFFTEA